VAGGALNSHPSCCRMEYTLNCIVLGEKSAFPVKINNTQSVGDLKKEIREQKAPEFNSFAPDKLKVYKLNIAISDPDYPKVQADISGKKFECNETDKLEPVVGLSEYFGDSNPPKKSAIHIVVVTPQSKSIDP